jgi:tetratricopeptide (TPR) repeat protein
MASNNEKGMSAAEQLQKVRFHLARKKPRDAYELLKVVVVQYSDDPFLLSYYGYLKAAVDGIYRSGIEDCSRALSLFQRLMLRGDIEEDEKLKAVLYLNLGRAYSAAGKRKDAYDTLNKGLLLDIQNDDIMAELQKMGIRKKKPLPFLERANPLNNFFGKMLRKPGAPQPASRA